MKIKYSNGKQRNRMHNHPLLKKGGVHQKSNKAQRRAAKQALLRRQDEQKILLTVVCAHPVCSIFVGLV